MPKLSRIRRLSSISFEILPWMQIRKGSNDNGIANTAPIVAVLDRSLLKSDGYKWAGSPAFLTQ